MIDYGQIIMRIRDEKRLTQREIADICHVTQAAIQKIEKGVIRSITAEFISELYFKLNVDPYVFLIQNYQYLFLEEARLFRIEQKLEELFNIVNEDKNIKEMKQERQKTTKTKVMQAR